MEAIADTDVAEVSTPELWDIVRIDDDYRRSDAGVSRNTPL
jgi:hypothetical protein